MNDNGTVFYREGERQATSLLN